MTRPQPRLTEEIKYINLYNTSQICMGEDIIVGGVILIIQRLLVTKNCEWNVDILLQFRLRRGKAVFIKNVVKSDF